MKGPTIDMTGLADRAGRFVRGLRGRASALWDRHRPGVQARCQAGLRWMEEIWHDHAHRANLLYRWMWRQNEPERPVRPILWASVRLLWGTSHELLGWPSEPPTEDGWTQFKPEFTPYTPDLDGPFEGLPAVGDPAPPPGELPPPPEV